MIEVNRTRPAERTKQGKSDRLDAYRAARSVVSGQATTDPKRASIKPAIYRALKRAVAREVFTALTGKCTVPQYADLRPARRAKIITLTPPQPP